jgi:hypothetical protein
VSPEQAALVAFWSHKRFWLLHSLWIAAWTALALGWFWLPDSHAWGVALAVAQGVVVIAGAVWLIRRAMLFYGPSAALKKALIQPRLYVDLALLAAIGVYVPYKLIGWHPRLTGLGMQTASLAIRFLAAYLLGVSAWLIVAALLARLGIDSAAAPLKSSPAPLARQTAQPKP